LPITACRACSPRSPWLAPTGDTTGCCARSRVWICSFSTIGGPIKLDAEQRRDLLEIIEDRYESRSTIVTSQLPVDAWYGIIGNPTIAVAVLDRLAHNAHRIELKGESLRKQQHSASLHRLSPARSAG
jgi:hypothetical protein